MRLYLLLATLLFALTSTPSAAQKSFQQKNEKLASLMAAYDEAWLRLYPFAATARGDNRYNDLFFIEFTDTHQAKLRQLYLQYLTALKAVQREKLSEQDKIYYDVFQRELVYGLEGLRYKRNRFPFDQQTGIPTFLPVHGSGKGLQPFKTVTDYDNWLKRAVVFSAWSDSAIVYLKKGVAEGMVLPKALVEKMIPQMAALISADPTKSRFYDPIATMPAGFLQEEKSRLTAAYAKLITDVINPSYQKLHDFLQNDYLPQARLTSGYSALPDGEKMYNYYARLYTTTNKTPDEIFNIGLSEVARIQKQMEKAKASLGYQGTLKELFHYMKTDPKFFPYHSEEEILASYRAILPRIEPKLKTMFNTVPQTPFEVRQVEAFRAASTAPNYMPGSLEAGRPGIFYVPIVKVSNTSVDESIFLHEAIPGHHYQASLKRENTNLPNLLRYGNYSAFSEGWGLYTESLGKELGVYTDPYQYLQAMSWEIHRAIRLVVDAGIHTKGWTREKALHYMMDNEAVTEQFAISEIERYMANPGQALSYKIGELKIKELRARYEKQLGSAFNLAAFHDALLKDGSVPLDVLERKMDAWAKTQKK
jgi:uncharacterized protein (DUF885 family)